MPDKNKELNGLNQTEPNNLETEGQFEEPQIQAFNLDNPEGPFFSEEPESFDNYEKPITGQALGEPLSPDSPESGNSESQMPKPNSEPSEPADVLNKPEEEQPTPEKDKESEPEEEESLKEQMDTLKEGVKAFESGGMNLEADKKVVKKAFPLLKKVLVAYIIVITLVIALLFGVGLSRFGGSSLAVEPPTDSTQTNSIAEKIVQFARQELAKNIAENPSESNCGTPYSIGVCEPWCADFVSWVYKEAGVPFTGGLNGGWRIPDTWSMKDWFKQYGIWIPAGSAAPQPGDVAFYKVGVDYVTHVNIVTAVNGNTYNSIGGNQILPDGNGGVTERNGVYWKNNNELSGFGRLK